MLHFLRITSQTLVNFFRVPTEADKERIEPKLRFGPTQMMHRRCCCIASDELPNAPTSGPAPTINLADAEDEITRGIAEFLRQLKDHRGGFRRHDETI
jgi:hypothetical protein